ncbi:endonuclease/exonuclease/phosphatase (EEP) superfamily protein YafD [Nocardiopsis sp. Huas11]|uniref:endonuclease/exonuclease/phosphatase family protein n=1 Tax=Nocardiopsis sp. Huas11 TaxID=2183912 RepID=UPI000F2806C3|nr:endonuclease/exonuclease/phosphatase family protein [Nocardiopsis sp. Huas11]RKS05104.1 endonuclease/exonuclease/phosphatase (EEP) superfamily protein YafD [Nocardiopsis sp. Huas11]
MNPPTPSGPVPARPSAPAAPSAAPRPRRRWVTGLCVLAAAGFLAFAALRLLGLERGFPLVPLLAYTPYVLPAALAALIGTALLRRLLPAAALLLSVVVLAAVVAPRALPAGSADDAGSTGAELRLLTLNAHFGHASPDAVVDLVREYDAQVLSLQEVTPELAAGLSAAGLDDLLPHAVDHSAPAAAGGSVHAVHPLTDLGDPGRDLGSLAMPRAAVAVPGLASGVEVTSVHPMSPRRPSSMAAWRDAHRALPEAGGDGPVMILAGDFNATLDHAELRRVLDTGYADAAATTGDGLTGTWPVGGPPLPRVALDHVLVDTRAGIRDFSAVDVEGSTHRALFVEVSLPEG